MATPPQPFDTEKAKKAWLNLLKGALVVAAFFAAMYYVFDRIENRPDTPLEAAVKAVDVEIVRRQLGTASTPEASAAALFVYRPGSGDALTVESRDHRNSEARSRTRAAAARNRWPHRQMGRP